MISGRPGGRQKKFKIPKIYYNNNTNNLMMMMMMMMMMIFFWNFHAPPCHHDFCCPLGLVPHDDGAALAAAVAVAAGLQQSQGLWPRVGAPPGCESLQDYGDLLKRRFACTGFLLRLHNHSVSLHPEQRGPVRPRGTRGRRLCRGCRRFWCRFRGRRRIWRRLLWCRFRWRSVLRVLLHHDATSLHAVAIGNLSPLRPNGYG